jgi:hypothetical protein
MVCYACKADGASLGEFDETVFREKIRSGELKTTTTIGAQAWSIGNRSPNIDLQEK